MRDANYRLSDFVATDKTIGASAILGPQDIQHGRHECAIVQQLSPGASKRDTSFVRLLLVWLLVGPSLLGFGWAVADAVPVSIPVSSLDAGLLFGTGVVAALWILGFRPSIPACVGYFLAENGTYLLLVTGANALFSFGATPSSWQEILLRSLSIVLSAAVVFTDPGRRARGFVRKQGLKLVKTPPEVNQ